MHSFYYFLTVFLLGVLCVHGLFIYILNFCFFLIKGFGSTQINRLTNKDSLPRVAVIIAVRNEGKYIGRLLNALKLQDYPNFEVIVVDDFSTDDTVSIVHNFPAAFPLRCLPSDVPPDEVAFKKRSVTIGIEAATEAEVIITTDGDCLVGPEWISALTFQLLEQNLQMLPGPVAYFPGHSALTRFQYMDFAGWVAVGSSSLKLGLANLCSGANLCYRKSAFFAVGGFAGKHILASGDDEFLLHKMYLRFGSAGVQFCSSSAALVLTEAQQSLAKFIRQRRRWTSKWKRYVNPLNICLAIFYIVFYVALAFLLPTSLFFPSHFLLYLTLGWFFMKFLPEGLLIFQYLRRMGLSFDWLGFLLYSAFVQYYLLFVGAMNLRRGYEWKGRKVH